MINLPNELCCGCAACYNICPVKAIEMRKDEEGFLYPQIASDTCIQCGKCLMVCPIGKKGVSEPRECFMFAHENEAILERSSSGGAFSSIAEYIFENQGIVFGAKFETDFGVYHAKAESQEDMEPLRGSKYVQSETGETFSIIKEYLDIGRLVCFSGTPCQINGLYYFLGKEYSNLITVGVICHGVPSADTLRYHLEGMEKRNGLINEIRMRDKKYGWFSSHIFYKYSKGEDTWVFHKNDAFMKGFLDNIFLRPSCYACESKGENFRGDILLGDYWGVKNVAGAEKGISAVIAYSEKGTGLIHKLHGSLKRQVKYEEIYAGNSMIEQSVNRTLDRELFFELKKRKYEYSEVIDFLTAKNNLKAARQRCNYAVESRMLKLKLEGKSTQSFFDRIHAKRIAIYGFAGLGELFYQIIKSDETLQVVVDCFVDKNAGWYESGELEVINAEKLSERDVDCVIVTAIISEVDIINTLVSHGFDINHIFTLNQVVYGVELEEESL